MRLKQLLWAIPISLLGFAGCASEDNTSSYVHAIKGNACTPDPATLQPPMINAKGNKTSNGRGGHNSPTGIPGDNVDDLHSGKIDCLYDGNSGQGNDRNGCMPVDFPRPGCDSSACCDIDVMIEPLDPGTITIDPLQPDPSDDDVPVPVSTIEQTR